MPDRSGPAAGAAAEGYELRVQRFDPLVDERPRWQTYTVPALEKLSVLDGLFYVLDHLDGSLAFRYSCRAGMCGSCAMVVNGRECLTCQTQLSELGRRVSVQPLRNLPVLRDLTVEMSPFWERYRSVEPAFVPVEGLDGFARIPHADPARAAADVHVQCIGCGACYSACGLAAAHPGFLGPAALTRALVLVMDRRDGRRAARLERVMAGDGLWRCHTLFDCTAVCPTGILPTQAIERLKRQALAGRVP